MILICSNTGLIKSFKDAYSTMRQVVSLNFVIQKHMVVIFLLKKTTTKILQYEFYWPTLFKDTYIFWKTYENSQKLGAISKWNMMPLNLILVIEIFDCWGIDFIGPFPPSYWPTWIFLANFVQGYIHILQNLWKLSKIRSYFEIKHDVFKSQPCDWNFWLLGI